MTRFVVFLAWFALLTAAPALATGPSMLRVAQAHALDDDDDGGAGGGGDDDDDDGGGLPVPGMPGGDDAAPLPVSGGDDDDGPGDDGGITSGTANDDDDDGTGDDNDDGIDDDDPEYGRYQGPEGPRDLSEDEILDSNGDLARRAEVAALGAPDWALRRARRLGFTVIETIVLEGLETNVVILAAPRGLTVRDALARLRAQDGETIYDYNHYYSYRPTTAAKAAVVPEAPVRAPITTRGDISIGLIDADLDLQHEALSPATIETRSFSAEARLAETDHGSAVAALLVGGDAGLAPRARLYAAGVFSNSAGGDAVSAALELVRALDWMIANKVVVINMSLAGPDNALLQAAVARAVKRGHIIVAAVGNEGPGAKPLFPASYEGVVGVTAVDAENKVYRLAARGKQVDLAAPGVDVVSAAKRGYARHTGTSFAAPHVAAALAARVAELSPDSAGAAIDDLISGAVDLGESGRDNTYGHGLAPPH